MLLANSYRETGRLLSLSALRRPSRLVALRPQGLVAIVDFLLLLLIDLQVVDLEAKRLRYGFFFDN